MAWWSNRAFLFKGARVQLLPMPFLDFFFFAFFIAIVSEFEYYTLRINIFSFLLIIGSTFCIFFGLE
jgi:hypothetical protein